MIKELDKEAAAALHDLLQSAARLQNRLAAQALSQFPGAPDPDFYRGLAWMHTQCCRLLDDGEDPRTIEVPALIERAAEEYVASHTPSDLGDE